MGGLVQNHTRLNPKHRNIFTWQLHSLKAVSALEAMLPYLLVKKEQALFAIEWSKTNTKFRGITKTTENITWLEEQKHILSVMKGYL